MAAYANCEPLKIILRAFIGKIKRIAGFNRTLEKHDPDFRSAKNQQSRVQPIDLQAELVSVVIGPAEGETPFDRGNLMNEEDFVGA